MKDEWGNNIFIAECKWWKGQSVLHSTINQLFDNYITWRDTKSAILFFVNNKNFKSVLSKVEAEVKKHNYYIKHIRISDSTNFRFEFRQKEDKGNIVCLEMMFFHFV